MSKIGALTELLTRLSKTSGSQIARLAHSPKVTQLTPQEIERIANAEVVLRRKHVGDILGEKRRMLNVHESNKTAAAAGAQRSIDVRSRHEPEMFGGTDVNYGYLTEDPLSTTKRDLAQFYPKTGEPFLVPNDILPQYGQYGFGLNDRGRERATFTLADSLDGGRGPYTTADSIVNPISPYHHLALEDSRLYQLAKAYDDKRTKFYNERKAKDSLYEFAHHSELDKIMKDAGFSGTFPDFLREQEGVEGLGNQYLRLQPRPVNDPGALPLMNTERQALDLYAGDGLDALLKRRGPGMTTGYVEAQVLGGVGPEDVGRLYDFNYEPSLVMEKRAKKLGIEYVPMPEDNLYNLVQRKKPRNMGELSDLLGREGFEDWRYYTLDNGPMRELTRGERQRDKPVPKFGRGFRTGGPVGALNRVNCK